MKKQFHLTICQQEWCNKPHSPTHSQFSAVLIQIEMISLSYPLRILLLSLLLPIHSISAAFQDEFSVRGPGELHKAALDAIFAERRANPGVDSFSEDSAMMQKAKEYAINRFMTKPDEALKAPVSLCVSVCVSE